MNKEKIIYNNIEYIVSEPGKLVFSKTSYARGFRYNKPFEIVDQLNNCSELSYDFKKGIRNRVSYLYVLIIIYRNLNTI